MSVYAYIRVSTTQQIISNQKWEVLDFCRRNDIKVDDYIDVEISSRKSRRERRIEELLGKIRPGDTIIVSELSRLGRSTAEVVEIVNGLVATGIGLICIKQNINIPCDAQRMDMSSKVMITMFSLFAELERDLISERTRQALAAKKAQGVCLGKPKGTLQRSKLDNKAEAIRELLKHRVAKSAISRMLGVSRSNLVDYIKSRNIGTARRHGDNLNS